MNEMFKPLSEDEQALADRETPKSRTKIPILPVPDDAPPMAYRHPKHGTPSRVWPYHEAQGRLVGYVCRWDFTDAEGNPAKDILPVTFCDLGNGERGWRSRGIPEPRPLFGLPEILARPEAPILVTEGEKTRDAAAVLFPDFVVTTPAHGAKSPHKTDFAAVAGRTVIIATDHDEPGRMTPTGKPHHPGQDFGDAVCELARTAGAASVLHLHPDRLGAWIWPGGEKGLRDGPMPDGWDLADALAEGWTAEAVAALRDDPAFLPPFQDAEAREEARRRDAGEPEELVRWPFRVVDNGVEKRVERINKETGIVTVEWRWFCSVLEVVADTRSTEGEDWGRLLRITDRDGRPKEWAMPMAMLAGDGTGYRERLLSLGLVMAPGSFARNALHEYISTARPDGKARCIGHVGWARTAFVLPRQTFEPENTGERILYQSDGMAEDPYRTAGDLAGWQEGIARAAIGNSRLTFALSAAFAGPLLYPLQAEGGGFHFRGGSSIGKTTALLVAGSVWGGRDFIRTWRATSNGLESVALMHCDTLLLLDEMGQSDSREVGQVAYMLANGQGKTRAGRGGEARRSARWRVLFLSTGEVGLADKMAEDGRGRRVAAGQEVRVIDIPADAGAGLGIFETLHGAPSADAFARTLKAAAGAHFGIAAHAFLGHLTRNAASVEPEVKRYMAEFLDEYCPVGADGQVCRVAARFALAAAGGEIATSYGILPWTPGDANSASARCFADWLSARGSIEPAEEREAVAAVRRFIEAHGTSRFEPVGDLAPRDGFGAALETRTLNRVGFRRRATAGGIEYLVLPEAWKSDVCIGLDPVAVARALLKRDLLIPGSGGKLQNFQRLPGFPKPVRCYLLPSTILGDGETDPGGTPDAGP